MLLKRIIGLAGLGQPDGCDNNRGIAIRPVGGQSTEVQRLTEAIKKLTAAHEELKAASAKKIRELTAQIDSAV